MKPFSDAQMKAWNQQAAAGDLAPEVRQVIAHGETVGKMRDGFKPRTGRKKLSQGKRIQERHLGQNAKIF
jgi:hypothetical protein